MGVYLAAFLSSTIFAVIHFSLNAFAVILWVGLYNCYLINKKGYWYAVFNHFVFNSITIAALLTEKLNLM
jgi:membrane protease YdiL (CAAX protease family)